MASPQAPEHPRHRSSRASAGTKRRRSQSPKDSFTERPAKRISSSPRHSTSITPAQHGKEASSEYRKAQESADGSHSPVRKLKRPGARARISEAQTQAIRERQIEREKQLASLRGAAELATGYGTTVLPPTASPSLPGETPGNVAQYADSAAANPVTKTSTVNDMVKQHYNTVPQRGVDWRRTESNIKGLRAFNNWVKSCLIQRYSPDERWTRQSGIRGEEPPADLLVLDLGCGKGGDLQKWANAPQPVGLYVGVDLANVSIEQAMGRYRSMTNRGGRGGGRRDARPPRMQARFHVMDCFSEKIDQLSIVREVGFDASPGGMHLAPGRGFDVVSLMFCMHYAYESEAKARTMLSNVAGALKKGGRFIGTIPNSDVLSAGVVNFNRKMKARKARCGSKQEKKLRGNQQNVVEPDKPDRPADAHEKTATATGDDDDADQAADSPPYVPNGPDNGSSPAFAPHSPAFPSGVDSPKHLPDAPPGQGENATNNVKPVAKDSTTSAKVSKDADADDYDEVEEGEEREEGETEPTASWGNRIYRVRFHSSDTPADGVFRPPYGWRYEYSLDEAVDGVPEYVVPWEAFRALAEEYNLELRYRETFRGVWDLEKDDRELGPLSERMGVRERRSGGGGRKGEGDGLLVTPEEMEAAEFYIAFCFYKV